MGRSHVRGRLNRPALKKINVSKDVTPDALARLILQLQDYLTTAVAPLLARTRAFSVSQSVDFVAATPKQINHGLPLSTGKTPSGWFVTDIDANTTIKRTAWDDKTITLQAANDCTATIEV